MNIIVFEKRNYRVRQIQIDDLGLLNIASTNLNNKLLFANGAYKSNEASYIDEQIYFFVEPEKLRLNNKDLIEYIKNNCL